jgi:uncharacterized protein (DUF1684 family)
MLRYLVLFLAVTVWAEESAYQAAIANWRQQKEAKLKADGGWLTVTGLFWLKEGQNRVDSAPGVFELYGRKTVYRGDDGRVVEMKKDSKITAGSKTYTVIERAGRYGVRLKDNDSKLRSSFAGMDWFPVRESYRITARFVSYPQPKMLAIPNILGSNYPTPSPGYAVFKLNGQEFRLEPVIEDDDKELFFIFRDQTAVKETYGAGRFLYTELPRDGKVDLDFNKAENPPCAFTPYATCPLPPKQNVLPVRIEAGELAPARVEHARPLQ